MHNENKHITHKYNEILVSLNKEGDIAFCGNIFKLTEHHFK